MICKCPGCGNVITYNIEDQSLTCEGCGNTFSAGSVVNEELWEQLETMECDIYKCSTCGAEIATNTVEASTFCGYCGQPTIMFNRVSSQAKPKLIIPFSVTKEEAEKSIRKYLKKSIFTKKSIKNFETERIVGIYIPFWLYDIDYKSRQVLRGTVGSGKHKHTYHYFRECVCNLNNLTVDASNKLNNTSSERLEPYNFNEAKAFDIAYLSGFYADCFDISASSAEQDAKDKTKKLFDAEVIKTVSASNVKIVSDNPTHRVNSATYAMLPAWFLSFMDEDNNCYTILVNGQTKKVIGAVPYIKSKVNAIILSLAALFSIPCTIFANKVLSGDIDDLPGAIAPLAIITVATYAFGYSFFGKLNKSISLTTSRAINNFANERQDI